MEPADIKKAVKAAKITNLNDQYEDDRSDLWHVDCGESLGRSVDTHAPDEATARKDALEYFLSIADDLSLPEKPAED